MCSPTQHTQALSKNDGCRGMQPCAWTLLSWTGGFTDHSRADFVTGVPQLVVCLHLFNDKLLPGSASPRYICLCRDFFFYSKNLTYKTWPLYIYLKESCICCCKILTLCFHILEILPHILEVLPLPNHRSKSSYPYNKWPAGKLTTSYTCLSYCTTVTEPSMSSVGAIKTYLIDICQLSHGSVRFMLLS